MASNIDPGTIDATYPIAGQDNDTQGFRDNYLRIKEQLDVAKAEISALQYLITHGLSVNTIADGMSITVNVDTTDVAVHINTQSAGVLTVNAPTGVPTDGQRITIRIKSTNVQTFSWNTVFSGSADLALPATTTGNSKYDYIGFMYNISASKWQLLAKTFGF